MQPHVCAALQLLVDDLLAPFLVLQGGPRRPFPSNSLPTRVSTAHYGRATPLRRAYLVKARQVGECGGRQQGVPVQQERGDRRVGEQARWQRLQLVVAHV